MTLRNFIPMLAFFFSASLLADVTVTHEQGTTTIPDNPETIVVFDMGLVDSLHALDVPIAGLPKDYVPDYLAQYRGDDYEHVGSLHEPDYEAVAALDPDLILVASRSAGAYEELSKLAPTLDLTVYGEGFLADFRDRTRLLGELFDQESLAETYLAAIDDKVQRTRELAAEAGEALIVMTSGGRLTAYGPGSRFALLHDDLGIASAAVGLEDAAHGDPVSFEFVLNEDPEYIFVIDRDGAIDSDQAAGRATMDNELIQRTQAYENDRIVYLNSVNWYIVMSGINTVEDMITEVLDALES